MASGLRMLCKVLLLAGCVLELTECYGYSTPNSFPAIRRGLSLGKYWEKRVSEGKVFKHNEDADSRETHYYTQTLDHFNYNPNSYETFNQRYLLYSKYWGGAHNNSPIFVYTGDETDIRSDADAAALMNDIAPQFRALLIYIEHRYYGLTMPFENRKRSFKDPARRGYLSAAQALADYATVIVDIKKNLSALDSPVIVFGGSYGGMLASWFRLKYPHIAWGALASSAPILYFDDLTPQEGYDSVVTRDFRNTSESCYNTIKNSWAEIDKVASQRGGFQTLSRIFKTCQVPSNTSSLINWITTAYEASAQYDLPPDYPLKGICNAIDGLPEGSDILSRISAGTFFYYNGIDKDNGTCFDLFDSSEGTSYTWNLQSCTEMVMPFGDPPNKTMFPASPFNITAYSETCESAYGVRPRPHWITTEFGGHNIRRVLKRFGSNIIFTNGLRDPYSSGGVLQSISDSIVAIVTEEGAHCADILTPTPDDPTWLKEQRSKEISIIQQWIDQYYQDLHAS